MIKRTLVALLVSFGVLLGACAQGAGPSTPEASQSEAKPSVPTATVRPATATRAEATPTKVAGASDVKSGRIDACTLFTAQDAEALLKAKVKNTSHMAPGTSKSYETRCAYRTEAAPDKGVALYVQVAENARNAETGFDVRVNMATKATEAVPGVGDRAVWAVEGVSGAGPARALYVVKGNVFFWLVPYSWAWAPEDAKGLASKIVSKLP